MENLTTLTRNEMRDIKAGSDCQWDNCKDTSGYYNCLAGKCLDWYSGNEQTECVKTVNSAHESMLAICNMEYQ